MKADPDFLTKLCAAVIIIVAVVSGIIQIAAILLTDWTPT